MASNNISKGISNSRVSNNTSSVVSNSSKNMRNNLKNTISKKTRLLSPRNTEIGRKVIITILIISLIVLVGVGGYFLYKKITYYKASDVKTKTFIPYIHSAQNGKTIQGGSIPKSVQGNEYNYNMWIYISDYTYRDSEDKCILYRGANPSEPLNNCSNSLMGGRPNTVLEAANPSMWLLKNVNTLRVAIGLETQYPSKSATQSDWSQNYKEGFTSHVSTLGTTNVGINSNLKAGMCDIENIPLQRWVNVNISQYNNIIDICIDGQLEKSCIMPGAPLLSHSSSLYVCKDGGYNGYIANLEVTNKALSVDQIYNIYRNGPTIQN